MQLNWFPAKPNIFKIFELLFYSQYSYFMIRLHPSITVNKTQKLICTEFQFSVFLYFFALFDRILLNFLCKILNFVIFHCLIHSRLCIFYNWFDPWKVSVNSNVNIRIRMFVQRRNSNQFIFIVWKQCAAIIQSSVMIVGGTIRANNIVINVNSI